MSADYGWEMTRSCNLIADWDIAVKSQNIIFKVDNFIPGSLTNLAI